MNHVLLLISFVMTSSFAFSQIPETNRSRQSNNASTNKIKTEQKVRSIDAEWVEAIRINNIAKIESMLADNVIIIQVTGISSSKREFISARKAQNFKITDIKTDNVEIRVFRNATAVTGHLTQIVSEGNQSFRRQLSFTRVYEKINGAWKIVAIQETIITAQQTDPRMSDLLAQHQVSPINRSEQEIKDILTRSLEIEASNNFERLAADLEKNAARDYIVIDRSGSVHTLEDTIKLFNEMKSGDLRYDAIKPSDMRIRVNQDSAIATYRIDITGKFRGTPFANIVRVTDLFVKYNAKWVRILTQVTPILAPNQSNQETNAIIRLARLGRLDTTFSGQTRARKLSIMVNFGKD